jgi:hypothetical protein
MGHACSWPIPIERHLLRMQQPFGYNFRPIRLQPSGPSFSASDLAPLLEETRSEAYFRKTMTADTILVAVEGTTIVGYVRKRCAAATCARAA